VKENLSNGVFGGVKRRSEEKRAESYFRNTAFDRFAENFFPLVNRAGAADPAEREEIPFERDF